MKSTEILRFERGKWSDQPDLIATEEPMEIRLGYGPAADRQQKSLAITMRTPGHDIELAAGFLYAEGILEHANQLLSIKHCTDKQVNAAAKQNIIRVELAPSVRINWQKLQRNFYTTSSCGICGKASIEAIEAQNCPILPPPSPSLSAELILSLPDKILQKQATFRYTGGLHAAALFDLSGELLLLREDVGRHNALDKLIGAAWLQGLLPLSNYICQLSGRLSFELVQKALKAGIPVLSAIGAPSSLAVELAQNFGQSLIGFVKKERFNVYAGAARIKRPISQQAISS